RACVDDSRSGRRVTGVFVGARGGGEHRVDAPVVVGADGRRSTVAFQLGLAKHPSRPRRWAIGAYYANWGQTPVAVSALFGEMHIRRNGYIGVAPVPGGLTNVCVVREVCGGDTSFHDPARLLANFLRPAPLLSHQFPTPP